jgi:hypothetical protein
VNTHQHTLLAKLSPLFCGALLSLSLVACAGGADGKTTAGADSGAQGGADLDGGSDGAAQDSGADGGDDTADDTGGDTGPDPYADAAPHFSPGIGAGYGQDSFPDVVLGPPLGGGVQGSLDVLSLGDGGELVLEFTDIGLIDGPGVDLIVFENPFPGWIETGEVSVSEDGEAWHTWPCDPSRAEAGDSGCAGVALCWGNLEEGIDPTDPEVAGGDQFDLADLGLSAARFVRVRDTGTNNYDGVAGGFDLDAVAIVHGAPLEAP